MEVWDDPKELGRRISAARGYAQESQETYGKRLGKSGKTISTMEKGDPGSIGRSVAVRRQTAELIVKAGAPPELFGMEPAEPDAPFSTLDLARAAKEAIAGSPSALDELVALAEHQSAATSPPAPESPGEEQDE